MLFCFKFDFRTTRKYVERTYKVKTENISLRAWLLLGSYWSPIRMSYIDFLTFLWIPPLYILEWLLTKNLCLLVFCRCYYHSSQTVVSLHVLAHTAEIRMELHVSAATHRTEGNNAELFTVLGCTHSVISSSECIWLVCSLLKWIYAFATSWPIIGLQVETPFLEKEIRLGSKKWCKNKSYHLHEEVCVQVQCADAGTWCHHLCLDLPYKQPLQGTTDLQHMTRRSGNHSCCWHLWDPSRCIRGCWLGCQDGFPTGEIIFLPVLLEQIKKVQQMLWCSAMIMVGWTCPKLKMWCQYGGQSQSICRILRGRKECTWKIARVFCILYFFFFFITPIVLLL